MKKGFIIVLLLLLIGGSYIFAGEESSRFNLSASVVESPDNTGIKIIVGDPIADKPEGTQSTNWFDTVFASQAHNDLTVNVGDLIMTQDATGIFSVLVKRGEGTPIRVNISGTPMQKDDGSNSYLGYQIKFVNGESIINTIGNPNSSTAGVFYTAVPTHSNNNWIRDTKIFEYKIPKNPNMPYGKYTANVYFSITLE